MGQFWRKWTGTDTWLLGFSWEMFCCYGSRFFKHQRWHLGGWAVVLGIGGFLPDGHLSSPLSVVLWHLKLSGSPPGLPHLQELWASDWNCTCISDSGWGESQLKTGPQQTPSLQSSDSGNHSERDLFLSSDQLHWPESQEPISCIERSAPSPWWCLYRVPVSKKIPGGPRSLRLLGVMGVGQNGGLQINVCFFPSSLSSSVWESRQAGIKCSLCDVCVFVCVAGLGCAC